MVKDGGRWKDDKVVMANCRGVCMFEMFERFYVPHWLYHRSICNRVWVLPCY